MSKSSGFPYKKLDMFGHTVTIKVREDLLDEASCVGRWTHSTNTIELQALRPDFNKSNQMQTFWHEVFHAMFDMLGYSKCSEDENKVDRMGQLMHQILQTLR